jgi:hypothetical protein
MTSFLLGVKKSFPHCLLAACLLLSGYALADSHSMSCEGRVPDKHAQLAEGDQSTATHLQVTRQISGARSVNMDVCSADLTITGSGSAALKVTVDIGTPAAKFTAADYLETLDVTTQEVRLQLHLPRSVHAKVTVELPAATPDLQSNLGRGDLLIVGDRINGGRNFNLGYGHVNFEGNKDAYETMQVNVGLGSLHDHRKGGEDHHLIVAKSFDGTGKGSVEINVGMGSVELNPGRSQPI